MVLFPKLKNNYLVFNHINDLSSLIIICRFNHFNNEYPTLNIQYSISPQARKKLMKTENTKKYDLEERLIEFALMIIQIVEMLPENKVGNHIGGQLLRSGTSPAFNYGEAQSAESISDFIHKMKVCLKELRETKISLKIIKGKPLLNPNEIIDKALKECDELGEMK